MSATVRRVLLGADRSRSRFLVPALALALFATVLVGYATGVFTVSGGIVWIPYYGAVVGTIAAFGVGYYRAGLASAWLVAYASVLGYHADHAFLGLTHRSLGSRLSYFVGPEGLLVLGFEALVLGTIAFALGALLRRGVLALGNAGHSPL